jgi:hypothetical protein
MWAVFVVLFSISHYLIRVQYGALLEDVEDTIPSFKISLDLVEPDGKHKKS